MMLVETMAVGLVFGVGGAAAGAVVVAVIRAVGGIPATTDMLILPLRRPGAPAHARRRERADRLVMVMLVSVLSGLYPALLAMRVTPVEAMATEE